MIYYRGTTDGRQGKKPPGGSKGNGGRDGEKAEPNVTLPLSFTGGRYRIIARCKYRVSNEYGHLRKEGL
jgi:hypothetical protein